ATCRDRLREGSAFILMRGAIQISPVKPPFIEPVSELLNWLMKQQRKLLREGVPISETGIAPYMDKIPRNLADKLKSLIPAESFIMEVSIEKLSLRFRGTLYKRNFQGEDSLNVLLVPQNQASSAILVFGITNTVPIFDEGPATTVNITPLAIYREY
ncbi:unnamed protein product, partial [marine sediment metagenome]